MAPCGVKLISASREKVIANHLFSTKTSSILWFQLVSKTNQKNKKQVKLVSSTFSTKLYYFCTIIILY